MLYPLSYRRPGRARNVGGNPAKIAPGRSVCVLVGPVRRRSALHRPFDARSAYRCAQRVGVSGSSHTTLRRAGAASRTLERLLAR